MNIRPNSSNRARVQTREASVHTEGIDLADIVKVVGYELGSSKPDCAGQAMDLDRRIDATRCNLPNAKMLQTANTGSSSYTFHDSVVGLVRGHPTRCGDLLIVRSKNSLHGILFPPALYAPSIYNSLFLSSWSFFNSSSFC